LIAFGPVPSRRLGRSLGINNIPPKVCSYSCVYCQLGRTPQMQVRRQAFHEPMEVARVVRAKVEEVLEAGEAIDYLTFVPDGEPTLDLHLDETIDLLRPLGIRIAVISNASLVFQRDVRDALARADWVSLKVDAVGERTWHRLDRPHGDLELEKILAGMLAFRRDFQGRLATETMLVDGLNVEEAEIRPLADFLGELTPDVAYLSIPIRPPAEAWVAPPGEEKINRAYQLVREKVQQVELLIGYEGDAFAATGDPAQDLLSITAVHPMREQAVRNLLDKAGARWPIVETLVRDGELVDVAYRGERFFVRRIHARGKEESA
jgi:wyosine [tRNA(Phe)-imidazoG37] synthetase (radical SAM superfamily)